MRIGAANNAPRARQPTTRKPCTSYRLGICGKAAQNPQGQAKKPSDDEQRPPSNFPALTRVIGGSPLPY
jgi:hypothetical protein